MSIRDEVRALPPYRFRARANRVKLDQNEAPHDLPAELRRAAQRRVEAVPWHRYPELRAERLRRAVSAVHDWPEEGVVVAAGSNVLIQALTIVAGLGRRVLTVSPTFSVYGLQAQLLGAELRQVPLGQDFALDVEGMLAELNGGDGVLFLADPAAPTGNRFADGAAEAVLTAAVRGGWTPVVDEAYAPFDGRDRLAWVRSHPGSVALRTLSKAFGLAGLRVGYALTDADTAEQIGKALLPFSVSALQSAVAEVVLESPGYVQERLDLTRRERERLIGRLRSLPGVTVFPSSTNFVLVRVPSAEAAYRALLARGVLVRRQDHLPGLTETLRFTVGAPEENDLAAQALKDALRAEPARG